MSLDVYLTKTVTADVYEANITHNLGKMANEAGIYKYLWRPEECGVIKAHHLITPLTEGLNLLILNPERFKALNPENGWGDYDGLVLFVKSYIKACQLDPDAFVRISR